MINSINQNPYSTQASYNSTANVQSASDTNKTSSLNSQQAQQLVSNILSASPSELFASVSANKINVAQALSLVD